VRWLTQTAIFALLFLGLGSVSHAATLYISPSQPKVSVGNIVSVHVLVSTAGRAINSADSVVLFPADLLEVVSLSKSSSIFSLWVEEPRYSAAEGKITLSGGLPNPGYIGESGEIVSVTFRAKKQGSAPILFSDSSVRQNDGLGTNILTGTSQAIITIQSSGDIVVPQTPPPGSPEAPIVISSTHPEQNKWYSLSDAELRWDVPNDVTAVSTLLSKNASAIPTVVYDPPIGNKKVTDLQDGVWYFHVRFKNKNGWGATTHFKLQVDTTPPNPFKILRGEMGNDTRPAFSFSTVDSLSGVDHYEVKIGDGKFSRVTGEHSVSSPYIPSPQEPGDYDILVKAIDLAGNETVQTGEFAVSSINPPKITKYPTELVEGDVLRIEGISYPSSAVELIIEDVSGKKITQTSETNTDGGFVVIWAKNLDKGSYTLSARAVDGQGAKSDFTRPLHFAVKASSLSNARGLVFGWLSVVIIIILALAGIGFLISYLIHQHKIMKKAVSRKIRNAESSVHKAFDLLRENVREQIKTLEKAGKKRELTKEEEKVIKHLQDNLTKSEEFLEKEISDIEDKLPL
jgi:hypothetical protein